MVGKHADRIGSGMADGQNERFAIHPAGFRQFDRAKPALIGFQIIETVIKQERAT